ncbi:hypothetical protein CV102_20605 [Natronococcus pandeyae]|uniref:Rpa-associated protein n=1 Tax=Natronococcus pandeyae TaxID=2055836 RepID=A0A8J8TQA4_9EURY|nr:hypothetical protein [Natronococcus pandeyae]TYL36685.1 hypothetical protein CV102_20605 [Natronococcus pandeyae]
MSTNGNDDGEEEIPGREIAYRVFAAEYDDASLSYAESDEERAPNYVITPTGARLNRLFAVGTLTEVTSVNDEMVRARVVDPTGAFVVYAGQYQPDELATLEQLEPPAFVAVTGKARTFQPDDSDRVYTSIRPESIATVDADTRDRWVVSAAEQTLDRIGTYAVAADLEADGEALADALREDGVESGLADGIPLAQDHYGTTPAYLAALRDCALEAVEVVAGDRDQVSGLTIQPGGSSPEYETTFGSLASLAGVDVDSGPAETDAQPDPVAATAGGSEPESMSAATADEFSAADDVPTDTAGDDPSFEAGDETDAETETEEADTSDTTIDVDAEGTTTDADETTDDAAADAAAETVEFDEDDQPDASGASDETDDDLGDFDGGGMYEMDDDEREQLEEEFGAEFATGTEVDDPGESDIDVPSGEPEDDLETESEPETDAVEDDLGEPPTSTVDADSAEERDDETTTEVESEPESEGEDAPSESAPAESEAEETADEADDTDEDEPADDVDLQAYAVETMEELDDGDGADRSTLVETVAADTGVAEADVEAAIEEALMGGQCYEPDDETLKAI